MLKVLLRAAEAYVEKLELRLVVQNADKVPNTRFFPHGASSATSDMRRIERALRATPGAVLAARVGHHLVLDVDVRHGGPERLAKLVTQFGPLPRTWKQVTPSGGEHYWFRPAGFRTKGHLAKGVEALYGNRCVTLSPSQRGNGRYRWVEHPLSTPLAEAPRWLLDALREPPMPARTASASDLPIEERERQARAYMAHVPGAISGQEGGRHTIVQVARVVCGFDLDADSAMRVLLEWNQTCVPPWSRRDLERRVREVLRRGSRKIAPGSMLRTRERAA